MKVIVIFDMWGQRCKTEFDNNSELTPEQWIKTLVEKGWMYPIEVYRDDDGLVLFDERQLNKLTEGL